mmetsp:Transcript_63393/g.150249  ORF Transcript_63393/g.150249 Transcript_63393/m.150249 type:complete len:201 (+) Transcript_63393:166-768(+)
MHRHILRSRGHKHPLAAFADLGRQQTPRLQERGHAVQPAPRHTEFAGDGRGKLKGELQCSDGYIVLLYVDADAHTVALHKTSQPVHRLPPKHDVRTRLCEQRCAVEEHSISEPFASRVCRLEVAHTVKQPPGPHAGKTLHTLRRKGAHSMHVHPSSFQGIHSDLQDRDIHTIRFDVHDNSEGLLENACDKCTADAHRLLT